MAHVYVLDHVQGLPSQTATLSGHAGLLMLRFHLHTSFLFFIMHLCVCVCVRACVCVSFAAEQFKDQFRSVVSVHFRPQF